MPRQIEMLPVEDLVPAERNPKAHSPETLEESLTRFGFIDPIVRDDRTGRLVSGHGRTEGILARLHAGKPPPEGVEMTGGRWLVPVVTGWASADDDEAAAAVIALNRIGERGSWDEPALAALLSNLEGGPGLAGLGYDLGDLDDLFARLQEHGSPAPAPGGVSTEPEPYQTPPEWEPDLGGMQQSRSMVFDFLLDDFRYLANVCEAIRREEHLDSNSQVFAWLLARREGVNA